MCVFNNFSLSSLSLSYKRQRQPRSSRSKDTQQSQNASWWWEGFDEYPLWPVKEGNLAALFHWEQLGQFSDIGWQPLSLSPVELGKACASAWPSPSQWVLSVWNSPKRLYRCLSVSSRCWSGICISPFPRLLGGQNKSEDMFSSMTWITPLYPLIGQ